MEPEYRPVDVISVCSAQGQIRPLRIRLEDEDRCPVRIDVIEVVRSRKIEYVGAEAEIFLCRATVYGYPWLFELKYSIRSHTWCLFRRRD